MQIKKLSLVVMAALVLTLGLAGCGNAKDTTTSGKANAAAAVVVEQGKLEEAEAEVRNAINGFGTQS